MASFHSLPVGLGERIKASSRGMAAWIGQSTHVMNLVNINDDKQAVPVLTLNVFPNSLNKTWPRPDRQVLSFSDTEKPYSFVLV